MTNSSESPTPGELNEDADEVVEQEQTEEVPGEGTITEKGSEEG